MDTLRDTSCDCATSDTIAHADASSAAEVNCCDQALGATTKLLAPTASIETQEQVTKPEAKPILEQLMKSEDKPSLEKTKSDNRPVPEIDLTLSFSRLCGAVNKMDISQLKKELENFNLDTGGNKKVLTARLKAQLKNIKGQSPQDMQKDPSAKKTVQKHESDTLKMPRFVAVVDFEATCEEDSQGFPNEIIEFPIVMIDTETRKILDHFQSYCRPTINPVLSEFCKSFTGISQEDVDKAPIFKNVLRKARKWISQRDYLKMEDGGSIDPVFATDGPWDFRDFLRLQCHFSSIQYPKFARQWINIRKHFGNRYKLRGGVREMLRTLGMRFEGREHCGLDDSRNIARIALQLIRDGRPLTINDGIDGVDTKYKRRFAPQRTGDGDLWQHVRIARFQHPSTPRQQENSTVTSTQPTAKCAASTETSE
eukprot:m.56475 g.56475  ORF g.56475 m.56475 type:complete len:425 (+) comp15579_c0_seq4:222-1496(+)